MNLRWLLGNFTDPQYHISRREQFRLSNVAHSKYVPASAFWARTAVIAAPFLAAFALIEPSLAWAGLQRNDVARAAAHAAVVVLFWPWCAWMYRSLYARPVRMAMRDAGYDVCLGCGYELRGLDDTFDRCPECGESRGTVAFEIKDSPVKSGDRQ